MRCALVRRLRDALVRVLEAATLRLQKRTPNAWVSHWDPKERRWR